ncbi:pilus assembly protein PilP [Legionella rowbothamii]|uniref:pilus assembly protein PilP n=1 Tax=Legionella rowbothamii TaxID=96229 RepID=UPI0010560A17|nr:pilus assembly protein PilP [Legionella rowbothamii]
MNYKPQITICIFSLLLGACSNDNHDLAQYIQRVKQQKQRAAPANPLLKQEPLFKLPNAMKRRNPFKPTDLQKPYLRAGKRYLDAHPLNSLKLVGVLIQGARRRGLIVGPETSITQVRVGDYLGKERGRIVAINLDEISLEKTIKSSSGALEKHRATLKLHTEKQE